MPPCCREQGDCAAAAVRENRRLRTIGERLTPASQCIRLPRRWLEMRCGASTLE